jgi:hypothetical protein
MNRQQRRAHERKQGSSDPTIRGHSLSSRRVTRPSLSHRMSRRERVIKFAGGPWLKHGHPGELGNGPISFWIDRFLSNATLHSGLHRVSW